MFGLLCIVICYVPKSDISTMFVSDNDWLSGTFIKTNMVFEITQRHFLHAMLPLSLIVLNLIN